MRIGNRQFDLENSAYIMGILNVTPDSFSDGGKYNSLERAYRHTEEMIAQGAAIIDIGGESTRPGHIKISGEEEIERVVPYIEKIKERFDIPVSIDTYKAEVAREAVKAGADLINDIWGFQWDKKMAQVAAEYDMPCCIMHNRDVSRRPYTNFLEDVLQDLRESIAIGVKAGVKTEKMITDPGIGFAKTQEENLYLMKQVERLKELGCPILLGTSKKRMIGNVLKTDTKDRVQGTVATTVYGVLHGCSIIRVHDVKQNYQAMQMALAIRDAAVGPEIVHF